jgi:4-hydroxythreonine-4-phosphate dehydrogenase
MMFRTIGQKHFMDTAAQKNPAKLPVVGVTLGDVNGIGPEVVARAAAEADARCRVLVIGDGFVVRRALDLLKLEREVRSVDKVADARFEPGVVNVLETKTLQPSDLQPGKTTAAAGRATVLAFDAGAALAKSDEIDALVFGPVHSDSIKASGLRKRVVTPEFEQAHLFLVSGTLRIAHLTDHMPLRKVIDEAVKEERIHALVKLVDAQLRRWGVARPRIGVAGLNPHCMYEEDTNEIKPAVERAAREGVDVTGPVSPDSVFRQCIEGRYDVVIALYHDQGHIAIKTWGFSGNSALYLGAPALLATVAHGSAFDIAWSGKADSAMMSQAIRTVGSLAAGTGFPSS